jgi:hypothetical protein
MFGQIGIVSHHLQSLLGAIELTIFSISAHRVRSFNAHIRRLLCTNRGFDLLASLKFITNYLQGKQLQNNLHSSSFSHHFHL